MDNHRSDRGQGGLARELSETEEKVRSIREIIDTREQEARDKVKKSFEGIILKIDDYRRASSALQSADPNSERVEQLICEFKEKEVERNRLVELYDRLYREILTKEEEKQPTPKNIELHKAYQKNLDADELRKEQLKSDIAEAERLAQDFAVDNAQQEERPEQMRREIQRLQQITQEEQLREKQLKEEYEILQKCVKGTPEEARKSVARNQSTLKDYDEHIDSLTRELEAKDDYERMLGKLQDAKKVNGERIDELTAKVKALIYEYDELRMMNSQLIRDEN